MLKNVTMNANFPAATTRQRFCGPEENQCVSHVAQHDPKDYHFEANMKIQYAYRDCVKANATQIYHTLYYKRYHFSTHIQRNFKSEYFEILDKIFLVLFLECGIWTSQREQNTVIRVAVTMILLNGDLLVVFALKSVLSSIFYSEVFLHSCKWFNIESSLWINDAKLLWTDPYWMATFFKIFLFPLFRTKWQLLFRIDAIRRRCFYLRLSENSETLLKRLSKKLIDEKSDYEIL